MSSSVCLIITHSGISSFRSEKRFPLTTTIDELKKNLEQIVGIDPKYQSLQLIDPISKAPTDLADGEKTLGDYFPLEEQELHVIDCDPNNSLNSILNEQPNEDYRFKLSEERELARKEQLKKMKDDKITETEMKQVKVKVGDRCTVISKEGESDRVGTVMFVGTTHDGPGVWIGVKFDQPIGMNDGVFRGQRYFECEPKHGSFVKPNRVFPLS